MQKSPAALLRSVTGPSRSIGLMVDNGSGAWWVDDDRAWESLPPLPVGTLMSEGWPVQVEQTEKGPRPTRENE